MRPSGSNLLVLLASLPLTLGLIATPSRVAALIDCSDPALQNLTLPGPGAPGGWTEKTPPLKGIPPNPAGSTPEIAAGDQNGGVARGTAQLFTRQVATQAGSVQCFYLRREFMSWKGLPRGTANGVLCFDPSDCSVCAWDKKTAAGVDPQGTQFSNMLSTSSYGTPNGIQNCSGCHVSGPSMPMAKLYQQVDLLDLMNTCVSVGGPKWVGAPPGWATQGPGNIVPASAVPATCSDFGICHSEGFLKPQVTQFINQTAWCRFAGQAFQAGGAMAGDYSTQDCETFMTAVGCDPVWCTRPAVVVPAISSWGLVSLAALLTAATGWRAIRRKQPPRAA